MDNFWSNLAPKWEYFENNHLNPFNIRLIFDKIKSPVLLIGAGQGLIVEYLKKKKIEIIGIDNNDEMIKKAKERRNLDIVKANAGHIPFKNNKFNTVIVSTGVIDYTTDKNLINKIIEEIKRVTTNNGNILISFYNFPKIVESFNKKISFSDDEYYYMRRTVEFGLNVLNKKTYRNIKLLRNWTNKSFVSISFQLFLLPYYYPEIHKKSLENIQTIVNTLGNYKNIYNIFPEKIPYRKTNDIIELTQSINLSYKEIIELPGCNILYL